MSVRVSVCLSFCKKNFFVQNGSNLQIRWTDISNSRIQARRSWFLVIDKNSFINSNMYAKFHQFLTNQKFPKKFFGYLNIWFEKKNGPHHNFFPVIISDLKLDAREKAGTSSGFIGCMKDVELSRKVISIQSEHEPKIIKKKNLVECTQNPCSRMPCANGGSCEAFEQGYKCNCKPKFTGT